MFKYAFNISLYVWRNLPTELKAKTQFWHQWITTLLQPLQVLHSMFYLYAISARNRAAYNSQTAVLEHLLNERFNGGNFGIYIDNVYFNASIGQQYRFFISEEGFGYPSGYTYFLNEQNPQIYSSYLAELYSYGATFIVNVPIALQGIIDENELRAVVDVYRLADKTFSIQYY